MIALSATEKPVRSPAGNKSLQSKNIADKYGEHDYSRLHTAAQVVEGSFELMTKNLDQLDECGARHVARRGCSRNAEEPGRAVTASAPLTAAS